jgi:hypothetical protein
MNDTKLIEMIRSQDETAIVLGLRMLYNLSSEVEFKNAIDCDNLGINIPFGTRPYILIVTPEFVHVPVTQGYMSRIRSRTATVGWYYEHVLLLPEGEYFDRETFNKK